MVNIYEVMRGEKKGESEVLSKMLSPLSSSSQPEAALPSSQTCLAMSGDNFGCHI